MAKGRMVSSKIATDRRLAALSNSTARLLYVTLITQADAMGRLRGEPGFVRHAMIPDEPDVTEEDVAGWLGEMVEQKLIQWYEAEGIRYIQLQGWGTPNSLCHQRLNRGKYSDLPSPPGCQSLTSTDSHRSPEGEEEVEGEVEGEGERAMRSFARPTLEQVKAYCLERRNVIDPQAFLDHYESNGWRVGKVPMRDWRASVRTWEKNGVAFEKPTAPQPRPTGPDPALEKAKKQRREWEREQAACEPLGAAGAATDAGPRENATRGAEGSDL